MKPQSHRRAAFTLAELMTALAVLGLFTALAMPVFINCLRSLNFTTNRIGLNRDFRTLTARLMKEARASGQYIVYNSFTGRTVVTKDNSGNFIVLLTMDANGCFVTKATGYYRHDDGSVRRFTVTEPGTSALPQNLPAVTAGGDYPVIVEFADDTADASLSRLFLNTGTSVVIYGQIRDDSRNKYDKTNTASAATNPAAISTYNFTISPRG